MKLPLNTDLTGKTVVITGAGGVLGGMFAKALAQAGGKVALLDLNQEAAEKQQRRSAKRVISQKAMRQMYCKKKVLQQHMNRSKKTLASAIF